MNIALDNSIHRDKAGDFPNPVVSLDQPVDEPLPPHSTGNSRQHGLFQFVTELRRRRVCRAATMYAVSMWLICQVLEIVAPELGLPDWTLKVVIVFGLLGFPIALILAWMLEITPHGLVIDDSRDKRCGATAEPTPRRPIDQVLDCGLVFAALIIAGHLAIGMLTTETIAAEPRSQRIAVVPFRVASGNDAAALSEGLVVALQHELATRTPMTVIAAKDPYRVSECVTLTGAVAIGHDHTRITVTLIDNKTQAVTWAQVFEYPRSDLLQASAQFAREIVQALPTLRTVARGQQNDHAI